MDKDRDGFLSLKELQDGFAAKFPDMCADAKEAIVKLFEEHSYDEKGQQVLSKRVFMRFYAEILFRNFDADSNGVLDPAEAAKCLAYLHQGRDEGKTAIVFPPVKDDKGNDVVNFASFWQTFRGMD